jgi:hypothetical protein
MKREILSVVGAIAIIIILTTLLSTRVFNLSDVSSAFALVLVGSIFGILFWGFKPRVEQAIRGKPPEKKLALLDGKFRHIEARFFYPPKHRWEKIRVLKKHWWEIWKQAPSHHKLVVVKDLRKAYYVGTYVWNLIAEGKIEWFSEEEQDIDEWCKREGYKLVKEDASEDKLLEPYFRAEIKDKKSEYRLGEAILFRTHYRGELTNGFFSNQIFAPTGKTFTDGLNRKSSFPFDTLESGDPNIQGKLNGFVNHQSNWNWGIPLEAPLGQYRVYMRVHNHFRADSRPIVHEEEDTFVVKFPTSSSESKNNIETVNEKTDTVSDKGRNDLFWKCAHEFDFFDEAFEAVQQAPEPRTEAEMLDYFQDALRDLCYNHDWNIQVEFRIERVFDYIPKKLSNEPNAVRFLHFIAMIMNRFTEYTRDRIGEKWLDELEKLYNDLRYETNSNILYILQELVQYDGEYLRKLIDDSSIRWSDSRFQVLAAHIGFSELKKRNEEAHKDILRYLLRKINEAEKKKEERTHERLSILYNKARR